MTENDIYRLQQTPRENIKGCYSYIKLSANNANVG